MDDIDIRVWALDRAIKEVGPGTPWERCFHLAEQYATFISAGTYATPVADAKKAEEEAAAAEHEFETDGRRPTPRCLVCRHAYGEGNHK